ncbi:MAG TPA: class F sortase [Dehalococcoidia bacterium]|nr:class F sortase [Dehalococcoidia bacterium]
MLRQLRSLDRRSAFSLGLILGSTALLAAGIIGIIVALSSDGIDLPSEGSIDEIVADATIRPSESAPPPVERGPAPVRFVIPGLYIDAPVITETLGEDSIPRVPDRPDQVAWYDFSASPGLRGNAVFTGHVDWQARGVPIPGVFYRLREMKIGDVISVTLEDGTSLKYRVTGNVATPYDDPNVVRVMSPTNRDVITVITCGGSWASDRRAVNGGSYTHRIIVRAERVLDTVSATGG